MKIKILVMSVGPYEKNGTTKWLVKLGAEDLAVVCLPSEFQEHAESYTNRGIATYMTKRNISIKILSSLALDQEITEV